MSRTNILLAFAWLLGATIYGTYIGATQQFLHSNAHAHAGILGFVISALFGMIYKLWPETDAGRLPTLQTAIFHVGVAILVVGKWIHDETGSTTVVGLGSVVTILGVGLMAWLFLSRSKV